MSHIEKQALERLYRGELPLEEQMEVMEHISKCEYCASAFAAVAEEMMLMTAPTNLKSRILHQAETLPVQLQVKQHILSKRMQLMLYSLKIGAAVLCSIMLLFMTDITGTHLKQLSNATDKFTQSVHTVTNQIVHKEVIQND